MVQIGATVEPFGSFVSNLFSRWGDLDISIELSNGSCISSTGKKLKQSLLGDLLRALRQKGLFVFCYLPCTHILRTIHPVHPCTFCTFLVFMLFIACNTVLSLMKQYLLIEKGNTALAARSVTPVFASFFHLFFHVEKRGGFMLLLLMA